MAKDRVPIPDNIAAAVLVASAHTCCKCEELGKSVQIHHIDEDPSNNNPDNLSVLCLQCHDETQVHGGFGRRLSATEVRLYRDNWLKRVDQRKRDADAIALARAVGNLSMTRVVGDLYTLGSYLLVPSALTNPAPQDVGDVTTVSGTPGSWMMMGTPTNGGVLVQRIA
jgi:hypothetical protein